MKKGILFSAGLLVFLAFSCATNPVTGKKTWALVPNSEIFASSFNQYGEFLKTNKVITGTADAKRVENVGMKIRAAAEKLLKARGTAGQLEGYAWEYKLVDSKEVNAWCMPGGKVAVYTGILPVTKDDDGLAVVMGHEISHALAGHGNERISQAMLAQYGGSILGSSINNSQWASVFQQVYPIGAQVGLLAYGRKQELEADKMGLVFAAMGGYNPEVAVTFWERMAASGGQKPPEFLSTHPSDATRIADLKAYMPEALKYYNPAK